MLKQPHTCIALLGGSFNPLHIGHLRIAIEVQEALNPERILFIPCAHPPHKAGSTFLPFALRQQMLEESLSHLPSMEVCPIEGTRPGPSYTIDTLKELHQLYPGKRLLFILGSEDLAMLPTWNRWQQLQEYADFVVVLRGKDTLPFVTHTVKCLWPLAVSNTTHDGTTLFTLPGGAAIYCLALPCLEISASLIRARWREGRSIHLLVPEKVEQLLLDNTTLLQTHWG